MTLLLVSDGGLERSACGLMAEALDQQGQRCITRGNAASRQVHRFRDINPWLRRLRN